jgi:hypothetical protein
MRATIRFLICLAIIAGVVYVIAAAGRSNAAGRVQSASGSNLPRLGTQLTPLPEGAGKAAAEAACLSCHASDIIRQQRLTRPQWTATLTKMANWGTAIPDGQEDALLDYLATHFGPANASFEPVVTRPVGR